MERLEALVDRFGNATVVILEFTSILCIIVGLLSVIYFVFKPKDRPFSSTHNRLRLKFGGWLALALEFQLGSDIVETTISATYEHLIELAAIAVIRTLLNYFLSKELKEEMEIENKRRENIEPHGKA